MARDVEDEKATEVQIYHDDGSVWKVNAELVAFKRADFYDGATSNSGEKLDWDFEEEKERGLREKDLLISFIREHMTWEELEPHAEQIEEPDTPHRSLYDADIGVF